MIILLDDYDYSYTREIETYIILRSGKLWLVQNISCYIIPVCSGMMQSGLISFQSFLIAQKMRVDSWLVQSFR